MKRHEVTDEQWEVLQPILPKRIALTGRRPQRDPKSPATPVGDEGNEPDVAAAGRAPQWKRLGNPRKQLGPRDSGGVVGTFL